MDNQRIAIYVRVSTDMQGDESIENQIERCKQYLQFKGFNFDTAEVISDIASGADDGRKGLSQLMEKINNKEIDVLIVTELSRLSRKIKTLINIIETVKSNDVVIIAVIQNIDTATPMGKAMILMTGLFAELERDNLKQRVKNTLDTKARNGNHTGGVAPYGYDLVNKELVPNPEKSKIVKKLFNDFILGVSLSDLSRNYDIRLTTVRRILASPTYIGTKVYGTRIVNNDGKVVYADPENIKYIPNAHPPIVDEETFYTVQKILNESMDKWRLQSKNKQEEYLLYGLLKCYNGHNMYGAESPSHYRYYKCGLHGEKIDHKFCPKKNISATEIEKDVINDILNFDISKVDIERGKKIKEAKLAGEISQGMFCSYKELGYPDSVIPKEYKDGVLRIIDENTVLGTDIREVLDLDDTVVEFEITPNRPDCLSIVGMAREIAASFDKKLNPINVKNLKEIENKSLLNITK